MRPATRAARAAWRLVLAGALLAGTGSCLRHTSKRKPLPAACLFATPPGVGTMDSALCARLAAAWSDRRGAGAPAAHHLQADGTPKYANRLLLESSPYLAQHAHNPVNWYPWGDEAFEAARALGRPVLLSIGYSTCHWCHVMEEESFEDEEIARALNEGYVAIKVDREERPDVDAVYMSAVQRLKGSGGWPMTVWLTADRKPFAGGTYYPPRDGARGAQVGFLTTLRNLARRYGQERDAVLKRAEDLAQGIQQDLAQAPAASASTLPRAEILAAAAASYARRFNPANGGLRGSTKFPSSLPIRFLLRHHRRTGDAASLQMATVTLEHMAQGGLYDAIGGGFHRYATDARWLVPHFEKMLYDNALLVNAYVEAYQVTSREDFARVARETLRYVARDMTSPDGAFYTATDADSLAAPSGRHKEEGRFFTWTPDELAAALGKDRARLVIEHYGVAAAGNFEGRTILHVARPLDEVARELGMSREAAREALDAARELLYAARATRPLPLRDEKIVASGNGLMIGAFARAALALGDDGYARAALRAAEFLVTRMRDGDRLVHSLKDGRRGPAAFLDDYAFAIAGLLDLYEVTGDTRWLDHAVSFDVVLERDFADAREGGYFLSAKDAEPLLAREKPAADGAQPSGNSVHASNLLRLHELTTDDTYRVRAEALMHAFAARLDQAPTSLSELLLAVDFLTDRAKAIVVVSPSLAAAEPLMAAFRRTFVPNRVLMRVVEPASDTKRLPLIDGKRARAGRATAYVCEGQTCALPTSDPETFAAQLRQGAGVAP